MQTAQPHPQVEVNEPPVCAIVICMPSKETPRLKDLGRLMRSLRGSRYQVDIAKAMGRNVSHVSRWESGKLFIEEAELEQFLRLVGADAERTMEALRLHRDAADPNWLLPGVGRDLAVVREYEDAANRITNYQPLQIPGPLQIEAYADGMIQAAGATEEQAEDLLAFRMARRDFYLSGGFRFEAIIGEQAIRYPTCTRPIAVEALRDLLKAAQLDHISVCVLPFTHSWYPARAGSFMLIESETGTPAVHLEHYRSSSTLTDKHDVRDYQDAAEALRRDAMGPIASMRLIADVADKLEST